MNYRMAWSTKQSQDPLILDRALEMAKKAVAIDDSYFDGHYELCIIYLYEQQHEKALAEAEEILKLSPIFSVEVWGKEIPIKVRHK